MSHSNSTEMSHSNTSTNQNEVKIIGLALNKQLGILKAVNMQFDVDNRLTILKGAVGQGKTTFKTVLDLGTKGQKTLSDKSLYGEVDLETQLLDGETKIFVGCKSKDDGSLVYTLYTKDLNGKIIREPVIDGIKATPSKYLELLQTELTWRMDELISENPVVQRKILLDLYKFDLAKLGVIYDKSHPEYSNSIINKIETAIKERDLYDMVRKQKGGILDDLKAKGFDPDRPDTIPDHVDVQLIEKQIAALETEIALSEQKASNEKQTRLNDLKNKAKDITTQCKQYNEKLKANYDLELEKLNLKISENKQKTEKIDRCNKLHNDLVNEGYNGSDVMNWIITLPRPLDMIKKPEIPIYIKFDEAGIVVIENTQQAVEVVEMFKKLSDIRLEYSKELESEVTVDTSELSMKIATLKLAKEQATEQNKIVEAVDSFHNWRKSNETVLNLKNEYYKMLASVNTGVDGLKIMCEEKTGDIFLMYNGSFDQGYFNNKDLEYRKLSSYSGTQKPLICLLVQNYLLSKKPKALRYMYIDNVPMDKRTQAVLNDICNKLELRIFLNITGDFDIDTLKNGEILIEGGEVFFK